MAVRGVHPAQWRIQACLVLLLCLSTATILATGRSYYDTLSVEPTASAGQIKKAFRKLALKYHPDKSKSADAEKTFREIVEAYSVLSNKEKRRLYDSVGHEMFLKDQVFTDAGGDSNAQSFSDFFHDFNGGHFGEEEPHFSWNFPSQDWEDEYGSFEPHSFEGPAGFSFFFMDGDENEEELHYF